MPLARHYVTLPLAGMLQPQLIRSEKGEAAVRGASSTVDILSSIPVHVFVYMRYNRLTQEMSQREPWEYNPLIRYICVTFRRFHVYIQYVYDVCGD